MKILLARLFGIVMFIVLLAGWYYGSRDVVSFFAAVAWILIFLGGFSATVMLFMCSAYDEDNEYDTAVKALKSHKQGLGSYDWLVSFPIVIATSFLLTISSFPITSAVYLITNIVCMVAKYQSHKRYLKINS